MSSRHRPDSHPTVLYVVGVGRSGSTVFDTVLGSDPHLEGLGELIKLVPYLLEDEHLCACGRNLRDCPFWSEVVVGWNRRCPGMDAERYLSSQHRAESSGPLRRAQELRPPSPYVAQTRGLYEAIGEASGRSVLVDSSKEPGRLAALARVGNIDVVGVHLIRHPGGVANSLRKSIAKSPEAGIDREMRGESLVTAIAHWVRRNLEAERVLRRALSGRYVRVRYEDFATDPVEALRPLGELLETDLTATAARAAAGEPIEPRHTVAGNRMRLSGPVRLAPDLAWRSELRSREIRLIDVTTRRLRKRYGYE